MCNGSIVIIALDYGPGGPWFESRAWVPIFYEARSTAQGLLEPSSLLGIIVGTRAAEHRGCNWGIQVD